LSVAILGAVVAGAGYLVFMDRRDGNGGAGVNASTADLDRLHGAELALAAAPDTEAAARELSKLAMVVLAPPAVVVIIEGIGDSIHMEAGDTAEHPADAPGSRSRDLWVDGEGRGSITIAPRPGRAYGEHEDRILEAIADQASFVLRRLALVEGLRTQSI